MHTRVITQPEPIVKPSDLSGGYADDDASVKSLIAAVTEEIDGPTGWLGRALGPQTLESVGWFGDCQFNLTCPPIIKVESIVAIGRDGSETAVDALSYGLHGDHVVVAAGVSWVTWRGHRIRYKAGYNGTTGAGDGEAQTGAIPERARQAIILSAQHLKSLNVDSLYLKADEIEGVGRKEYTLSDQASSIIERTCDRLLAGLRIYSL